MIGLGGGREHWWVLALTITVGTGKSSRACELDQSVKELEFVDVDEWNVGVVVVPWFIGSLVHERGKVLVSVHAGWSCERDPE